MPNENNTNQINSGDIGNFPDTALGQENHTHHSPAVREEAGQEKIQAIAEREAKAIDEIYEIPLSHARKEALPPGHEFSLRDVGTGQVTIRSADDPLSLYPSDEEMKRRLSLLNSTRRSSLHQSDETPYSYIPPMRALIPPPFNHGVRVDNIYYASSRKAKLRKIRQLKKRVAAAKGAKKYLFKELLKTVKRKLNKIHNSSLSGAFMAASSRGLNKTGKIRHQREKEFLLYGVPFPKARELSMVEIAAQFGVSGQHQVLTRLARGTSGLDGDLSGTQNMRRGLARVREMADIAQRFSQGAVVRHEGPVGEYYTPDVSDYKRPDENCKGCDNCEKKLPVLELMESDLKLEPVDREAMRAHIHDVSIKDMYPEHYAIQEVAAPDHQAMGEMQGAIHETLFPGKIVAQGSIDRTGNGDDAAGDERFALDA